MDGGRRDSARKFATTLDGCIVVDIIVDNSGSKRGQMPCYSVSWGDSEVFSLQRGGERAKVREWRVNRTLRNRTDMKGVGNQ